MSLPSQYDTSADYFEEVLRFLKDYDWLYNYANTDILINRVFDRFSPEWIEYFRSQNTEDLNKLSAGITTNTMPKSLKIFFEKGNSFKPLYQSVAKQSSKFDFKKLKIGKKKCHEIQRMSTLIEATYTELDCNLILDVGSGLGYLPELLYEKYKYNILGLEGDLEKYNLALKRQSTLHPHTQPSIKYFHHFVTESSAEHIKTLSQNHFPEAQRALIVGLHACADLTPTIIKLFLRLDFLVGLVIMPCCYHRLQTQSLESAGAERFRSFPASKSLGEVYGRKGGERFLRRYFLRLACQQTAASFVEMSEKERGARAEGLLHRAILEEAAREVGCRPSRTKRKTGLRTTPSPDPDASFSLYATGLGNTHVLHPSPSIAATIDPPLIDSPSFQRRLIEKWHRHKGLLRCVEALDALQTSLQSACENLVLLDAAELAKEGGGRCRAVRVTDDRVSPRCHALVARKGVGGQ